MGFWVDDRKDRVGVGPVMHPAGLCQPLKHPAPASRSVERKVGGSGQWPGFLSTCHGQHNFD